MLARSGGDNGNRGPARELLAPVYEAFTEGFDTPDLRDAKALLRAGLIMPAPGALFGGKADLSFILLVELEVGRLSAFEDSFDKGR